jgi:hypothetical protein
MKILQTKGIPAKRATMGLTALAIVGLAGAYSLGAANVFGPQTVSAHGDRRSHWSSRNNQADDASLVFVTDALEMYLQGKGTDPDTVQVTDVMMQGDYAIGHFASADAKSLFFAQKTDGKWTVLFDGPAMTPEAQTTLQSAGFPRSWVSDPAKATEND